MSFRTFIPMPVVVSIARRSVQNMEATATPKFTSLATITSFLRLSTKPKMLIDEGGLGARARACIYSKHVARLNLVNYGWEQGMEAAIVAHDTRKQEDAIRMNRQHVYVNQWVKEYSYTKSKCIITDACEDATTDAHARMTSSSSSSFASTLARITRESFPGSAKTTPLLAMIHLLIFRRPAPSRIG